MLKGFLKSHYVSLYILPLNKCLILSAGSFIDVCSSTRVVKHVLNVQLNHGHNGWGRNLVKTYSALNINVSVSHLNFWVLVWGRSSEKKVSSDLKIEEICSENHKKGIIWHTGAWCSTESLYKCNQTLQSLPWELLWLFFFFQMQSQTSYKNTHPERQYSVVTTELSCPLEQHVSPLCASLFPPTVLTIYIIRTLGQGQSLCLHSSLHNGVVSLLGSPSAVVSKI